VLAFLVITGRADLWEFLLLAAVNGTADAANFPAMAGMVPQLVPRSQLQPANALLSLSRSGLRILGPSVSAGLVVTVGPGWGLAVNAAMWVLSTVFLLGVSVPPKPPRQQASNTLQELREGWRFFASTPWLWVVVLAFSMVNALLSGAWFTLGPARAKETIGVQGWGLMLSAESVGLVVTGLVLLRLRLRRPLLVGMLGFSLYGVPVVALGLRPELGLLLVLAFLAGVGAELFGMGWNLAMQENVEDDMLARAYSYDALGSFTAMPIGQLLLGPLGDRYGLAPVLVASGAAMVVTCLLTLLSRSVRTMDRRPVDEPDVASTGRR
jgi:MFS family permease